MSLMTTAHRLLRLGLDTSALSAAFGSALTSALTSALGAAFGSALTSALTSAFGAALGAAFGSEAFGSACAVG